MTYFPLDQCTTIPKVHDASTLDKFRPIALTNFKFKIISKILADRIASLLPHLISKEQKGFIKGINICDCICIASEAFNLLDNTSFGGNVAIKVDVIKAFDTLSWDFLLQALKAFGFSHKFLNWISFILKSARLSVVVNGSLHGYFSCERGVQQGDPLSPILFCLAEEVLSQGTSHLVASWAVNPMIGGRKLCLPSHTLYANDILVFCKGSKKYVRALFTLFSSYASVSGQCLVPPNPLSLPVA